MAKGDPKTQLQLPALSTPQARWCLENPKPRPRTCSLSPTEDPPPKQRRKRQRRGCHLRPQPRSPAAPQPCPEPRAPSPGPRLTSRPHVTGPGGPRPPALTGGDAQLLGAAAKAPHDFAAAEVRQVLHDAVRSGLGLRPGAQVRRGRRGGGARTPGPAGGRGRESGRRAGRKHQRPGGAEDTPRQSLRC